MKVKRKIISVLLFLLIFTQIFSICKLNILATSGANTFITENVGGYNCYVYSNPNALPNTFSVYWVYGGKVCTAPATRWLIAALNKKLGTTFTDNWFTDFNTYFMTQIMSASSLAGDFFTGGATRVSNGSSIVGVAFNDLTGLTLENDIPSNATITTPSNCINVTYNILNNYLEDNPQTPPYVIIKIYTKENAQSSLGNAGDNPQWQIDFNLINSLTTGNNLVLALGKHSEKNYRELFNRFGSVGVIDLNDTVLSLATSDYNSLVTRFSLSDTNFTVELTDLLASTSNITPHTYNLDGTSKMLSYYIYDDNGSISETRSLDNMNIYQYFYLNNYPYMNTCINEDGQVTIYQSNTIPLQIQNNTYNQNFYTSSNYKNYDNTSNNSFNMTYNNVNNSQSTNQNIYNETKTTTNQNIENNNYNIDNSVNENSTTTIINNYYGDSGGGGGDDPTPDPNPDDDDSIWKALLKAIGEFFEKIGELLATILTGIVTLFTDILGAITEITTGFTAITDFLGSVFSWLPAEIIAILTLGLSLGVFICLIKLFK